MAVGTGEGVAAISRLPEAIAARTPRSGVDGPLPPTAQARVEAAAGLWWAALGAPARRRERSPARAPSRTRP
ncbi:hypothetical protein SBD_1829 [Streptomyces bottropensis ATCC 25435]|uniref:Uncharacterized protein n=1 Tax=Streptomyces bottropensis ATCC 25435 TaxID=1054862 RepID=M3DIW5_9ACTN|nr:hypothetical protein SBD_1829 [Streptomyces bottropensis ATCC 25435]